jgi:hypothetical protein
MTQKQLKLYKVAVTIEFVATSKNTLTKHERPEIEELFNEMLSDNGSDLKDAKLTVSRITSPDGLPAGWNGRCLPWGDSSDLTCGQILSGTVPDQPNKEGVLARLRQHGHITDEELEVLEDY